MPNFTTITEGSSLVAIGKLTRVTLISTDAEGVSQVNVNRIGTVVPFRVSSTGDSLTTVSRLYPTLIVVAPEGHADAYVLALKQPAPVTLTIAVEGTSDIFITGTRISLRAVVIGEGDAESELMFFFPTIRIPGTDELRGTVNFVRNAALILPERGLTDWLASNGPTLIRSNEQAKYGAYSGKLVFNGTGVDQRLAISSQKGLRLTASQIRSVVGSLYVRGTMTSVATMLQVVYTDTSYTLVTSDPFDLDTAGEWARVVSPVVDLDITKTVDYFAVFIERFGAAPANGTTLYVDAVQIEDAAGGTASPLALGSFGPGYAWFGTPDFSMSLRETMVA